MLIPKANKTAEEPSSYCPICLIDHLGKVLERLILNRLQDAVERSGGLSSRQFGFRRGKSTIDALISIREELNEAITTRATRHRHYAALVALGVKNLFNTILWVKVLDTLRARSQAPADLVKITEDYFANRWIRTRWWLIRTRGGKSTP